MCRAALSSTATGSARSPTPTHAGGEGGSPWAWTLAALRAGRRKVRVGWKGGGGGSPRRVPLRYHWQRTQGRAAGRETGGGRPEGTGGAPPRPADPLPSRSSAKGGANSLARLAGRRPVAKG